MTEFEEDCIHHYGKVLTGKFKHFCSDFDYLPIDETCFHFEYCLCEYTDWDMVEKGIQQNAWRLKNTEFK